MSTSPYTERPLRAAPDRPGIPVWLRFTAVAAVVVVTSLLLAHEIVAPDVRTVQILLAGLLVFAALRVQSFTTLLFIAIAIPTYKPTTYGGTTLAFVLVLFILWMVRLSLRLEHGSGRSAIDIPVVALVLAYILSFSQIEDPEGVREGVFNIFTLATQLMTAFMVIHLTRTEKQLRTLIGALVVMALFIDLTALWELLFPGRALIPGWLNLGAEWAGEYAKKGLEIKGLRVAGVFFDFELLAEFCALSTLLIFFALVRVRTLSHRVAMAALLVLNIFILFATVTRGAIVSLCVASGFLLWEQRAHLKLRNVVIGAAVIVAASLFMIDFIAQHTHSGNVLTRLEKTEFVGLVPESRVGVWQQTFERIMQKPIFGHGPYYQAQNKGIVKVLWPHNSYFFYWHMLGIIGLLAYLWLLGTLWRQTRWRGTSLAGPSFPESSLLILRAMLVLFAVDQIKIEFLRNPVYPYWVWLFFGLIVANSRIVRESRSAGAMPAAPAESPARRRPLPVAPQSPLLSH